MTIEEMLKVIYSKLNITCEKCSEFGKIKAFIKRCGENPDGCLINDCLTSLEPRFGITRDNLLYSNFFEKLITNWDTVKDKIIVIDNNIYFESEKVTGNPAVFQSAGTSTLHITANWEPAQEGSGDPSPDNIRPITGRNSVLITRQEDGLSKTLTLPETIYGGTVDAVTGNGKKEWALLTLTGEATWSNQSGEYDNKQTVFFSRGLPRYNFERGLTNSTVLCNKIKPATAGNTPQDVWVTTPLIGRNPSAKYSGTLYIKVLRETIGAESESLNSSEKEALFKAWLAEQYAAGTPIQVAYKLVTPTDFTATGGGEIKALEGVNTMLTDADNLEVIGRISQT